MAKNKPPELQEQLKELAEGFAELMRQDKMQPSLYYEKSDD